MTRVRFQADADLRQAIVSGVIRKNPTVDFQSANDAKLEGVKDIEVLELAARHNRLLVTYDRRTMPMEFSQFVLSRQSPGLIVLSRRLSTIEAIDFLLLVWEASTAEEWIDRILAFP